MTRKEKQKAIDALKISAPVMAVTQEGFEDYIQTLNKIMDWLEQEPTTKNNLVVDLISRAEVLKLMKDNWHTHNGDWAMQESMDDIRALPSVTPQEPRWISVSERLPEETGWYLVTFNVYGGGYAVGEMSYRKPENYWTRDNICKKVLDNDDVIAWMPLPEPYKAESEDNK